MGGDSCQDPLQCPAHPQAHPHSAPRPPPRPAPPAPPASALAFPPHSPRGGGFSVRRLSRLRGTSRLLGSLTLRRLPGCREGDPGCRQPGEGTEETAGRAEGTKSEGALAPRQARAGGRDPRRTRACVRPAMLAGLRGCWMRVRGGFLREVAGGAGPAKTEGSAATCGVSWGPGQRRGGFSLPQGPPRQGHGHPQESCSFSPVVGSWPGLFLDKDPWLGRVPVPGTVRLHSPGAAPA